MLQCISDQLNSIPSHNLVMNIRLQRHTSTSSTCYKPASRRTIHTNVSFLQCEPADGLHPHVSSAVVGLLGSAHPLRPEEHVYPQ